jgi:hypothetical protein
MTEIGRAAEWEQTHQQSLNIQSEGKRRATNHGAPYISSFPFVAPHTKSTHLPDPVPIPVEDED